MDDAVADRHRRHPAQLRDQPVVELAERGRDVADFAWREVGVDQAGAGGILGDQVRPGADALHLAAELELEPVASGDLEQLELDAGRAGVDDEQGLGHRGHSAARAAAARRLWA